jgi:hypothetical protein
MSKQLYKEALDILDDILVDNFSDPQDEYNDCYMLNFKQIIKIEKAIKKAQKQEELLRLYKEYFEYSEMLKDGRKFGGRMLVEHERDKIIEEIKELEKEIENDK